MFCHFFGCIRTPGSSFQWRCFSQLCFKVPWGHLSTGLGHIIRYEQAPTQKPSGMLLGEKILHWMWIFPLLLSPTFMGMFSFPGGQGYGLGWETLKKPWVLISPVRWTQVVSMCESISQVFLRTDKHHQHFFNPRMETFSLHNAMNQSQSSADLWGSWWCVVYLRCYFRV